jgi:ATP-dependent DNA helicase RecG
LGGDWIDRLEIRDALPQSIDAALAFVRRNSRLSSRVVGLKREDLSDYLQAVVREAVSNAVTHRDYSLWGANVRLFMFDDRIEVRSPGGLPGGLTLERLPFGAQYSRNPTIFFFLKSLGYGDRYGTGIPRMIKLCREEGIRQPTFQEFENEFVVTIYARE